MTPSRAKASYAAVELPSVVPTGTARQLRDALRRLEESGRVSKHPLAMRRHRGGAK